VLVPVPVFPVGFIVQTSVAGRPLKITEPVATAQVGCVIVPAIGAVGTVGCALITTLALAPDVHPAASVTVNVREPVASPVIVVLVPLPVIFPGLIVHVPLEGSPFKITLPVPTVHVGWVIVPTTGAPGNIGAVITILLLASDVQPVVVVTV
jgi:hypothetical protein